MLAIQQGDHLVEQMREMDDLAVGPAGQVGGLLVGGALILAEQLGAFPEPQEHVRARRGLREALR